MKRDEKSTVIQEEDKMDRMCPSNCGHNNHVYTHGSALVLEALFFIGYDNYRDPSLVKVLRRNDISISLSKVQRKTRWIEYKSPRSSRVAYGGSPLQSDITGTLVIPQHVWYLHMCDTCARVTCLNAVMGRERERERAVGHPLAHACVCTHTHTQTQQIMVAWGRSQGSTHS